MSTVVQGAAERVPGAREHGVIFIEGSSDHTGGVKIIIWLGGVVAKWNISRTNHTAHSVPVAGEPISASP